MGVQVPPSHPFPTIPSENLQPGAIQREAKMSPWFSVWGLVSDMAGVAIITYDVWPEYSLHRLREDVRWANKALIVQSDNSAAKSSVHELVKDMLESMDLNQIDRLRHRLDLPPITDGRRSPSSDEVEHSKHECELALASRAVSLSERWRPPLGLGAILVVLGFFLQLVGAWPHQS